MRVCIKGDKIDVIKNKNMKDLNSLQMAVAIKSKSLVF